MEACRDDALAENVLDVEEIVVLLLGRQGRRLGLGFQERLGRGKVRLGGWN
jgi:hypothetical protein